jgi:hypothetical protein
MERITIPAGTIVHICGIPFYTSKETDVESHPRNIAMLSGPHQQPPEPPIQQWLESASRPWWKRLLGIR